MKLLFVHERVNPNGSVERLSSTFDQDQVLIGRGGASHIILSTKRLSLVHAKITRDGDKVTVTDIDSLSGVRVNNARVAHVVLASDDVIQLGDLSFRVRIEEEGVTLTLRTIVEEKVSEEELLARQARGLLLDSYIPSMRVVSLVVALVVLMGCFVYPVLSNSYSSWSSGPISNAHGIIESDCQKCHSAPFEQVQDRECLACHTMSEHAKGHDTFVEKHTGLELRCAECHMEHNGDHGLTTQDSRRCVSCHGSVNALNKESSVLDVSSFVTHPQFRISVKDESGRISRVSLDDVKKAIDTTPIRLSHKVHLKAALRGPKGPQTLQCNACHQLSSDKRDMEPITFDKHCRDCHSLGFDDRIPDSQVPHGNAELIYPTLFAEYAKLLLIDGGEGAAQMPESARAIPEGTALPPGKLLSPDAQLVQADARRAEQELFTRTGCFLCHNYSEKSLSEQKADATRYMITKPQIPDVWLTNARFDHSAHEELSCESCHDKTRDSTDTKDVLLPSIKLCRECHMQDAKPGFVESACEQCHAYHVSLEVPREKKQSISEFISSMTR